MARRLSSTPAAYALPTAPALAITAANILIANGTRAVPPSNIPPNATIITSDDISGLKRLPRTMVVAGAGVIGIDYASMFAALGVEVTVIDKLAEEAHEEVPDDITKAEASKKIDALQEATGRKRPGQDTARSDGRKR